jgi:23S rRNA pseudouridine1911/1915/1917 synthase
MPTTALKHEFIAVAEDEGLRLDQVLALRVPGLSRRRARVLIDIGGVFLDSVRTKVAGRVVRAGQTVTAHLGGALLRATNEVGQAARARDAATLPRFEVVHLDEHIVVVDKPAGLLTAPTPESDRNNLADLLQRGVAAPGPLFVVHRLDLHTSGVLVFARTDHANRVLSERFRVHDMERQYLCVVGGAFPKSVHTLDAPIAGRRALTRVSIEERLHQATFLRLSLFTGRTHQIRIHLHGVGHSVLGDPERRSAEPSRVPPPPRMALHATRLGFVHPATGAPLRFDSPWPADLGPWLEQLRAATAQSTSAQQ